MDPAERPRRDPHLKAGVVCEVQVGTEVFTLTGTDRDVAVRAGAPSDPDTALTLVPRVLLRLASGRISPSRAREQIDVQGDTQVASDVIAMLWGSAP